MTARPMLHETTRQVSRCIKSIIEVWTISLVVHVKLNGGQILDVRTYCSLSIFLSSTVLIFVQMDRDGAKYEKIFQQEAPETTMGAWNDNLAHSAGEEDHLEDTWPVSEGRENSALALTQLGLDNGIEMMVNELRKLANIGEDILKHSNPENPASDTAIYSHIPDAFARDREQIFIESTGNNQQCVQEQSPNIEEQQATSGACCSRSPTVSTRQSVANQNASPHASATHANRLLKTPNYPQEKAAQANEEDSSVAGLLPKENTAKVVTELSKLFEHTSTALSALTSNSANHDELNRKFQKSVPFPRLSDCQLPRMAYNLKWLEERVVVSDTVLGPMKSQDWMNTVKYFKIRFEKSVPTRFPHDEVVWFTKRLLLLCCSYDDIQALGEKERQKEEIETPTRVGSKKTDAKSVQQRVRTNLHGDVVHRDNVIWWLLAVWKKEDRLPIFRLAILCILVNGCAFTSNTDITLGQFLESTFCEELLPRPDTLDKLTWVRYSLLTIGIMEAITNQRSMHGGLPEDVVVLRGSTGQEKDLSLAFSSLFAGPQKRDLRNIKGSTSFGVQDVESTAAVPTSKFDVHDLDIKRLKRLGSIHIKWTDTFDDHLKLRLGDRNFSCVCWRAHLPSYHPSGWYMTECETSMSAVDTCYL